MASHLGWFLHFSVVSAAGHLCMLWPLGQRVLHVQSRLCPRFCCVVLTLIRASPLGHARTRAPRGPSVRRTFECPIGSFDENTFLALSPGYQCFPWLPPECAFRGRWSLTSEEGSIGFPPPPNLSTLAFHASMHPSWEVRVWCEASQRTHILVDSQLAWSVSEKTTFTRRRCD